MKVRKAGGKPQTTQHISVLIHYMIVIFQTAPA